RGRLDSSGSGDPVLEEFDVNYWTAGGEASVSIPHSLATFGLYYSKRSNDASAAVKLPDDDASGNAGLFTFSYTNPSHHKFDDEHQETDFSITGQIGRGGAYVGESQDFTPDLIFLSKLAPVLIDPTAPIGAGLAHKWYYGVIGTTPQLGWAHLGKGVATLKL